MNRISGCTAPDSACAEKLLAHSARLASSNCAWAAASCLNTWIRVWPLQASSTVPLSTPVARHCAAKAGRDRAVRPAATPTAASTAAPATRVIRGDSHSIMASTPTRLSADISTWLSTCCRLWLRLSRSLVMRLMTSPRGCWSNQARGSTASLSSVCWRSVRTTACNRPVLSQACHPLRADDTA